MRLFKSLDKFLNWLRTSTSVAVVASSQQASSSNTVTTTQAGHKRPRETGGDSSTGGQNDDQTKVQPQTKRTRTQAAPQEIFQGVTESGVEVEYQVPTSSQRDQEDDVIVLSEDEGPGEGEGDAGEGEEMDADDDVPVEESGDGDGDGYEIEAMAYEGEQELVYDDADCPDMEDSEPAADGDDANNEVEIIDDSSEVPNQSGSSSSISAAPEQSGVGGSNGEGRSGERDTASGAPATQAQAGAPQSEAISSGSEGTAQTATFNTMYSRNRHVTPLSRQQQSQLLLPHGFEEIGDDGIVPSTPTLYVPRRTDGFGEAVSSPHVPSGRFTFGDSTAPPPRAGIAQAANEGIDDNRGDLSQLDDSVSGGLSWVRVTVPQFRVLGEMAQLICDYDLGEDVLYSVKWYKDHEEFYRYLPKANPQQLSFELDGLQVDLSLSDSRKVVLRALTLKSSGLYRCEVSAEAPSFASAQSDARMEVVYLPKEDPQITGVEPQYQIGDEISLNCTSGKSHPASVLHWYINEQHVVSPDALLQYPPVIHRHSLVSSTLGLRFVLSGRHLLGGSMRVKCVASVSPVLWQGDRESVVQRLSPLIDNREAFLLVKSTSSRHITASVIVLLVGIIAKIVL